MKKPIKQTFKAYIWSEVNEYIKQKHGKELRDWSGHFKDNSKPYQDFWYHLINTNDSISNGSILQIYSIFLFPLCANGSLCVGLSVSGRVVD